MNGILVIDKPQGITSHAVVGKVRRALGVKRVGHAGTLDPLATGLLVVGVGSATRLIEYLQAQDKGYVATFRLGLTTDSQDITGTVVEERDCSAVSAAQIENACSAFVGEIDQVPPMFSALKRDGVPLYRLARKGIEVERASRRITISRLEVVDIAGNEVTIAVACSKGTYIRTLCHDIGARLGCGGCMTSLRRVRSGAFDESMAVSLEDVAAGRFTLLSASAALAGMPRFEVTQSGRARLADGIPPRGDEIADFSAVDSGTTVQLVDADSLLAIASYDPEHQHDTRGDFRLLKVFPGGI